VGPARRWTPYGPRRRRGGFTAGRQGLPLVLASGVVSTRMLLVLSLLCGLAILGAFAVQLVLAR
jgi:hypothetical protein